MKRSNGKDEKKDELNIIYIYIVLYVCVDVRKLNSWFILFVLTLIIRHFLQCTFR